MLPFFDWGNEMTYLSYGEYEQLSVDPVEEETFNKLSKQAKNVLDVAIRRFYQFNDFEKDHIWRQKAVKLAMTYQIDFFNEVGSTTFEGINSKAQSVSLGRTNISKGSNYRTGQGQEKKSLLSEEARNMLIGTGLLYRGVRRG